MPQSTTLRYRVLTLCVLVLGALAWGYGSSVAESAWAGAEGVGQGIVPYGEVSGSLETPHSSEAEDEAKIQEAIAASLPFLEREGTAWMDGKISIQEGASCVSCHQVPFALWGYQEARRAGVEVDAGGWQDLAHRAVEHALTDDNGRPGIYGPLMLAEVVTEQGEDWDTMLRQLMDQQDDDGRWRALGQFPSQHRPVDETDAVITRWNLLAVEAEASDEIAAVHSRAYAWQAEVPGESTETVLTRMLLAATKGDFEAREMHLDELQSRQNEDGGWSFLAGKASDAMTTGQVLYALALVGDGREAAGRGVEYLLAQQDEQGSWEVPSRLVTEEASEANDYVYHVWGTAWATIGLSRHLNPSES